MHALGRIYEAKEIALRGFVVQSVRFFVPPWMAAWLAFLATISEKLLKLVSFKLVVPPNHLIPCHSLLLLPSISPSIRVFSNESPVYIRWPKYWSFSFSISHSNEYSGLISFRMNWISLLSKELSRGFLNTSTQKHQFFSAWPSLWSNTHIHTWLLEKP